MKLIATLFFFDLAMLTVGALAVKTIILIPIGLIALAVGCIMTVDTIKYMIYAT